MPTAQQKALGLANSFKMSSMAPSTIIQGMHNQFNTLVKSLPEYYSLIDISDPTDPIEKSIISLEPFPQRYILVLGVISKALSTQIYMNKILVDDDIMPYYELKLIGPQSDITLINGIAQYLQKLREQIREGMKKHRPKEVNARNFYKELDQKIFNPIIQLFHDTETYIQKNKKARIPNLKIREEKVLHYLINNVKFEYEKESDNPVYSKKTQYKIHPTHYSRGGKFKKHKLVHYL